MASNTLGLNSLEPQGRSTGRSLFTDDEWDQIERARGRKVSWQQIQAHTGRYKTANTLNSSFRSWKKKQKS
jgi:pyridoxine 5'-phosphate synthase PdxJ